MLGEKIEIPIFAVCFILSRNRNFLSGMQITEQNYQFRNKREEGQVHHPCQSTNGQPLHQPADNGKITGKGGKQKESVILLVQY